MLGKLSKWGVDLKRLRGKGFDMQALYMSGNTSRARSQNGEITKI